MPSDLVMDGQLAVIRVKFELPAFGDGERASSALLEVLSSWPASSELDQELRRVVRAAFPKADVSAEVVRFEVGSVIATIALVGSLVIDAGGFLAGLREISRAIPEPIADYLRRRAAELGFAVEPVSTATEVELGVDMLATVPAPVVPAPATPENKSDQRLEVVPALLTVAIVLLLLAIVLLATGAS